MAEPVLRLDGVRKSYGVGSEVETEVLHGIDLSVEAGELAALVGPSGSGKSTLLNVMGLLEAPTSGEVWLAGAATSAMGEGERTRARGAAIGFVFQFHHLLPAFTALENVALPLRIHGRGGGDDGRGRAAELLSRVGLGDLLHRTPRKLSGGQQQRVAVARALALRPAVVLADEPTGNLDSASSDEVFALLRRECEAEGTAFLVVTHDRRMADRCDRVIALEDGRVVSDRRS